MERKGHKGIGELARRGAEKEPLVQLKAQAGI